VAAKDRGTGKEQRIRIEASSGLNDDEIRRMREEAKANAEADNKAKEKVDKINTADSMIFTTEKQLKEFGDKLPADKKPAIESALAKLKEAYKSQDIDAIDKALAELNSVWQVASEEMYKTAQNSGQTTSQPGAEQPSGNNSKPGNEEVTDVDFEEVK
jgi:molecular chaperone DnaK